jgi:hypothetical protein
MKSAKKDDEDGLHYSVEKLLENLVLSAVTNVLEREAKKKLEQQVVHENEATEEEDREKSSYTRMILMSLI